ncbi:MAG: glutamate--tRNA ligase family protein [Bacteroidia bacterium]|nr:glutamate--tRNA ligase family protein [Bacteroidia bacterium]
MIRSRIAPTPSGYLHKGNGVNFVLTYLLTKLQSGKIVLRIDDMDQARVRPAYLDDIFLSLEWLGLEWDEGPESVEDHLKKYSQIHRLDRYKALIESLLPYSFACECSRKEISQNSIDGQYPGTCKSKNLGLNTLLTSLRIITENKTIHWVDLIKEDTYVRLDQSIRDFVIQKKDSNPAYQLSSLSDDLDMGINFIVRGEDLVPSTAAQLHLANLSGKEEFRKASFLHHPLVQDENGYKLSKSNGAMSLQHWREGGDSSQFYEWFSRIIQLDAKIYSINELLDYSKEIGIEGVLEWFRQT